MRALIVTLGLGAAVAVLGHPAVWAGEHWLHGMAAPWPAPALLGYGQTWHWLVGLVLTALVGVWVAFGASGRGFRIFSGAIALACVTLIATGVSSGVAFTVADAWRWAPYLALLSGVAAGGYVASGRASLHLPRSIGLRSCFLLAPLLLVSMLAVPDLLRDARQPRCEQMHAKSLSLVAAYQPVPGSNAIVMSRGPEAVQWIDFAGNRFQLDRADTVELGPGDVGCIRWYPERRGINIIPRGPAFWRTYQRSLRRMSQLDAIFVDGQLGGVPLYQSLAARHGLYLEWPVREEPAARRFYESLARAR